MVMSCKSSWGWVVVGLVFVLYGLILGPAFNYSILLLSFQEEFHTNTSITGWVGSLAHSITSIGTLAAAVILRRCSPRVVMIIGVVLFCGGYFATSFIPSLGYAFLTYGFIGGLGMSFVVQAGIILGLAWFPKKYCARATAVIMIGTPFGALVSGPLLNELIAEYGWRHALMILSSGIFAICLIAAMFLTTPPPSQPSEDVKDKSTKTQISDTNKLQDDNEIPPFYRQCDPWLWSVGIGVGSLSWGFLATNLASFMDSIGLTVDDISLAIIVISVGEIIGKIIFSIFADSLPFLKLFFVAGSFIFGAILSGLLTVTATLAPMIALSFFFGLARAAFYGTVIVSAMEIFSKYGVEVVTLLTLVPFGLGILISAPLSGGLFDLTGDYTLSLLVLAFFLTMSTACILLIPFKWELRSWRMRRSEIRRRQQDESAQGKVILCAEKPCEEYNMNPAFICDLVYV